MSIRALLVSAGLLGFCGAVHSQQPVPQPIPNPGGTLIPPTGLPSAPSVFPSPTVPPVPREKSVDDLIAELEHLSAQKAELEKKEQELKTLLRKKVQLQTERLQKLGVTPKPAEHSARVIPAPSPLTFAKDGPKKDKGDIVIVILPQAAPGSAPHFAAIANELGDKLARHMPELAKDNEKQKLKILTQTQVDNFKEQHPTWKKMSADEIGQKLGADFVLDIRMDKMRLYQPGSLNNIYEGRAEIQVTVYEVGTSDGMPKDKYPLSFSYPKTGVRAADAVPENTFKGQFIENLASEIAKMHVDRKLDSSDPKPAEPDRVGRVILEGTPEKDEKKILDVIGIRPGQLLRYPALEETRTKLEKAGFRGVTVDVVPSEFGAAIKDIRVRVDEPNR